jgi:Putative Actinobacterial Holin-X, holin superfamily III
MPPATVPSRDALHRLLDALQTLIREHLALARVELKHDLRTMGRDLATGAAGVPPLAAGFLLLMFAIASLLSIWLPAWAAFGIVALVNLAAGGAITLSGSRRIAHSRIELPCTAEEIRRDREWVAALKNQVRGSPANAPTAALSQPGPRPDVTPQ